MSHYVDFDPDWYAIGAIEPDFSEELVGWQTQEVTLGNFSPVQEMGSKVPVGWIRNDPIPDDTGVWEYRDIEPQPVYEKRLRWRRVR